ncbi:LuxR C-terminal-related transcriptional regulator [Mesobacterium sp. TK19101]|uniref:LuxR C-terminal-related transcriptional regulator n=1 Tax=Mesobacterium hydrothermale TaxID=3111907 RepID=A0ABU6HF72_9RHOB|nr:LuxR C-terminal-related transcriptional regulator [Mesobacterium sp. TK19101]MEC3861122.1 LuxR C-terminal-related transcriptional regulator [Mesobacterium sp. TK19101]
MTAKNQPWLIILLIAAQILCAAYFLLDALSDGQELGMPAVTSIHFHFELVATLSLILAIVIEGRLLMALLRRKAHLERQVSLAAGAFQDIIEDHFQRWGLTPSEQDVANFTIKGFSIPEIAELRGSAEGTVKSHLNGIYRKAGVSGRGALLSLLIEDLIVSPDPAPSAG